MPPSTRLLPELTGVRRKLYEGHHAKRRRAPIVAPQVHFEPRGQVAEARLARCYAVGTNLFVIPVPRRNKMPTALLIIFMEFRAVWFIVAFLT